MIEILPVFISSCLLTFVSHVISRRNPITNEYQFREKFFFYLAAILMALFSGLRVRYNDTGTYVETYIYLIKDNGSLFENVGGGTINWLALGENPGFIFVQNILKHIGFSKQSFLLFFSVITVMVIMWFLNKYSYSLFFSVYLLFTLGLYIFTMAAIKQSFAIAVGLIALDQLFKGKKLKFVVALLFGSLFHPYILMFLVALFFTYKPWTKPTYLTIGVFVVFGFSFQLLLKTIVDITTILGESYDVQELSGSGINVLRVVVYLVPILLSWYLRKEIAEDADNRIMHLFINMSILNGLLMFLALFGNAIYFARLADYFTLFSIISIPYLISRFRKETSIYITLMAFVLYFIFFWYDCVYGGLDSFDNLFDRITLEQYFTNNI